MSINRHRRERDSHPRAVVIEHLGVLIPHHHLRVRNSLELFEQAEQGSQRNGTGQLKKVIQRRICRSRTQGLGIACVRDVAHPPGSSCVCPRASMQKMACSFEDLQSTIMCTACKSLPCCPFLARCSQTRSRMLSNRRPQHTPFLLVRIARKCFPNIEQTEVSQLLALLRKF